MDREIRYVKDNMNDSPLSASGRQEYEEIDLTSRSLQNGPSRNEFNDEESLWNFFKNRLHIILIIIISVSTVILLILTIFCWVTQQSQLILDGDKVEGRNEEKMIKDLCGGSILVPDQSELNYRYINLMDDNYGHDDEDEDQKCVWIIWTRGMVGQVSYIFTTPHLSSSSSSSFPPQNLDTLSLSSLSIHTLDLNKIDFFQQKFASKSIQPEDLNMELTFGATFGVLISTSSRGQGFRLHLRCHDCHGNPFAVPSILTLPSPNGLNGTVDGHYSNKENFNPRLMVLKPIRGMIGHISMTYNPDVQKGGREVIRPFLEDSGHPPCVSLNSSKLEKFFFFKFSHQENTFMPFQRQIERRRSTPLNFSGDEDEPILIYFCCSKINKKNMPTYPNFRLSYGYRPVSGQRSPITKKIQKPPPPHHKNVANPCDTANCSHVCKLRDSSRSSFDCGCPIGVKFMNDSTTHCHDEMLEFLILSLGSDIRIISLDTWDHPDLILNFEGIRHVSTVSYFNGSVYWTDDQAKKIGKGSLKTFETLDLITKDVGNPVGLAVDWTSQNLYWSDSSKDTIEVSRLDGKYKKIIVKQGLDEPRAVALDPSRGLLFWSDWGEKARIEKANFDGSGRANIIIQNVGWPNGIAVDLEPGIIYWCDAKMDKIEMAHYDGSNRRALPIEGNIPHPFGLTVLGNFVYWTDWHQRTIERAHKLTGGDRISFKTLLSDPMGLVGVNPNSVNYTLNPCGGWQKDICHHLCLYNSQKIEGNSYCACASGFQLAKDNRTCSPV